MGKTMNLGKVAMTTAGDYNPSVSYERLTCVVYNHTSWVSRKDVPAGVVPGTSDVHWQKISERGEQGIQGPVGPQGNSAFDGNGVEIVNNLKDGGESSVLSAEQGKILKEELTELSQEMNDVRPLKKTLSVSANNVSQDIYYRIDSGETIIIKHSGANGALIYFGKAFGQNYVQMSGNEGSVMYTATTNTDTICIYAGGSSVTVSFELYKKQGADFYEIKQDYDNNLRYHYGKLNRIKKDFNLSTLSQSQKIPFFVKAGNTFRIHCTGITSNIAMFGWDANGTRLTLFPSIRNEISVEAYVDSDIEAIAFVSNETQTCNATIEIYDADSYVNKAALSASMNAGDLPFIVDKTGDFETAVQQLANGAIARERGFDIPLGNTGNSTMIEFNLPKISDDCDCFFECITNLPAKNFSGDWAASVKQESDNIVRFKIGKSINLQQASHRCIVFVKNQEDTSKAWYLRLSKIIIYPQTPDAFKKAIQRFGGQKERALIEVCKDFTESTTGYGESRYTTLRAAVNGVLKYGYHANQVFRIMPGIYDEFASDYPVESGETNTTRGIKTKVGQTFESFDIYNPELTVLKWDGHDGLDDSVKLTKEQAMSRCIFHVNEQWDSNKGVTLIQGLKFIAANVRYCIHPESAGYAVGKRWEIKHCILEWNGCPKVNGYEGRHLGIGMGAGESGLVEDVLFTGSVVAGMGGHDNAYPQNRIIATPQYLCGCQLHVKGCNLGGGNIFMNTFGNSFDNINSMLVENCNNIGRVYVGFEGNATDSTQQWKFTVINCDVNEQ